VCARRVWIPRDEQDVQALKEHGVDVHEVACQDAGGLEGQELPPGRRCPARCRAKPGRGQDPPDGVFTDPMAEAEQFAPDAAVPPSWILSGRPDHQIPHLVRDRRTLTAQNGDLMSKYQDLHLFGGVGTREERQPAEQPDHQQIQEA